MPPRSTLLLAVILALLCGHPAPAADADSVRQAFVAAMQRVRQNLPDTPDSPELDSYVIHDYLLAARMRRDLAKTPDDALDAPIDAFLQAHANQPVTHALKHDWLLSLAARHRWDWFLPRSADVTDAQLLCAALAADNPRLAREFAVDVPVARTLPLLQWSDLLESPKSALTVLASHPTFSVESDALAAGFEKLARADAAAAHDLLPQLLARPGLTPALQARLERAAALAAAYDRDPRAIAEFDALPADAVDGQVEEWRVRAALWAGDYGKALGWIDVMHANLATQPRWRYWRARATAATAGSDAAKALFGEIAGLRDYYGYLAADRLHQSYNLNAHASPDDSKAQAAIAADAGMMRAHELFACDMTDEAALEWAAAIGGADPAVKIQAAHLAARWGWYAQSIAALAQAGEWDDVRLRYPRPYPEAIAAGSGLASLPADWILGVMRQESLYRKDAVSRADARGLMQMLPATALAVARRWHLPVPRKETLFDPAVAVPLGAAYLRELLDRYSGQLDLSLAAYNAGPQAVARWLPPRSMDADVWIENIPYGETRSYVQHIVEHIVAFAYVRDIEPPRLDTLMPPLEPARPLL